MKKLIVVFVVCIVLAGCSAPTPTPTVTLTATATPMPTLIPTKTPIPIPTPTPKTFPASYDAYAEEVKENCVSPSPEVVAEMEKLAINGQYPMYQSPDEGKGDLKWVAMQGQMMLWLKNQIEDAKSIESIVAANPYSSIDSETWYCIGDILFLYKKQIHMKELDSLLSEEVWGRWEGPVVLNYWTKDGLVVYNYEPTMPAP